MSRQNKNPRSKRRGISLSFRAPRGILVSNECERSCKIPHCAGNDRGDDNKRTKLRGERSEGSKPKEIEFGMQW